MQFIVFLAFAGMVYSQLASLSEVMMQNRDTLQGFSEMFMYFPSVLTSLEQCENITILAPSNAAFKAFLKQPGVGQAKNDVIRNLLFYHVLKGIHPLSEFHGQAMLMPTILGNFPPFRNMGGDPQVVKMYRSAGKVYLFGGSAYRAQVEKADIPFDGGLIHILNSLIAPPLATSETLDILNMTSLAGGLAVAGLTESIDMLEGVTVFAPKNSAFRRVGSVLQDLSRENLADVLTYHVVDHALYSSALGSNRTVNAINGKPLTISTFNGSVFINGARLLAPDVIMNNGVIHLISSVLNPNNTDDKPEPPARTRSRQAFPSATTVAKDIFTATPTPSSAGRMMAWPMSIVGAGAFTLAISLQLAAF